MRFVITRVSKYTPYTCLVYKYVYMYLIVVNHRVSRNINAREMFTKIDTESIGYCIVQWRISYARRNSGANESPRIKVEPRRRRSSRVLKKSLASGADKKSRALFAGRETFVIFRVETSF